MYNRLGSRKKELAIYKEWYFSKCNANRTNHYTYIHKQKREEHIKFSSDVFDNRCAYCGMKYETGRIYEVDHFKSKANYVEETHNIDNLVLACKTCNSSKGDIELHEFLHPNEKLTDYYLRNDTYKVEINDIEYDNANQDVQLSIDKLIDKVLNKRHVQLSYAIEEFDYYRTIIEKMIANEHDGIKKGQLIVVWQFVRRVTKEINTRRFD